MSAQLTIVLNDDGTTTVNYEADGASKNSYQFSDISQVAALDAVFGSISRMVQQFNFVNAQAQMEKYLEANPELKAQVEEAQKIVFGAWQQSATAQQPQTTKPVEDVTHNSGYL